MANRSRNNGNSERLYFGELQNHCRWWRSHEVKKCLRLGIKGMTKLDGILKVRDITLPTIYELYTFIWARLLSVDGSLHSFAMQEKPLGFWCEHSTSHASQFTSEHQYQEVSLAFQKNARSHLQTKTLLIWMYIDIDLMFHTNIIYLS